MYVPADSRGGKVLINQGHRYLRKSRPTSTTQMRLIQKRIKRLKRDYTTGRRGLGTIGQL